MQRDIELTWFYPYPAAMVWQCLTEGDLIAEWLMKNDFKPVVGHKFTFTAKPVPGWNGTVFCEVVEIIPLQKISFTWRGGPEAGVITMDTKVTWTLNEKENGTELILEHTGFSGLKNFFTSFILENGWKKHIVKRFATTLVKIANHGK
ncbi:MAG: SRPBCC domain-containing protein [Flavipsychrobacter sp.]|nr:SRPBCC domain-containing protein [Flavipsychrobacter sp.]